VVSLSLGKCRRILMGKAEKTEEDARLVKEFLAKKGNNITVLPAHARTDPDDIVYTFKVGKRGRPAAKPPAKDK
jgi:nuclear transport factor 2 (NTF2) superfamily protein